MSLATSKGLVLSRNAGQDLRKNTCHWCGEYVRASGGECSTCPDAMEFYPLQQAAQGERGRPAIKKLRATRG